MGEDHQEHRSADGGADQGAHTEASEAPDPEGGGRDGSAADRDADTEALRDKIAIIGTAPGWEAAPFADETWEIWGISRMFDRIPRWDAWFELHRTEEIGKSWEPGNEEVEQAQRSVYLEWLRDQTKPVFVHEPTKYAPRAMPFPFEAICDAFPRAYYTNTISWLIAFAILRRPQTIGVWGVDMELSSEYGHQRPSCEYWLGMAEGLGIGTVVPERSDLLKARQRYALDRDTGFMAKIRAKRDIVKQIDQQSEEAIFERQIAKAGAQGALEMLDYVIQSWER